MKNELSFKEGGDILFIVTIIFLAFFACWWLVIGIEFWLDYENVRKYHPTISSYYSDKTTNGYIWRYTPGVCFLVLFLCCANTSVFIIRYAEHGEELMDILSYCFLIISSVLSILLLYPLHLYPGQGCCRSCGVNEQGSENLHQCGGLFLLCVIPLIEAIIYCLLLFYFRHEKVTNWISFGLCLLVLLSGAALYGLKVFWIDPQGVTEDINAAVLDNNRRIVNENNEVIYPEGFLRLNLSFFEAEYAIQFRENWGWLSCFMWKNSFMLWWEWAFIASIVTLLCLLAIKKVMVN